MLRGVWCVERGAWCAMVWHATYRLCGTLQSVLLGCDAPGHGLPPSAHHCAHRRVQGLLRHAAQLPVQGPRRDLAAWQGTWERSEEGRGRGTSMTGDFTTFDGRGQGTVTPRLEWGATPVPGSEGGRTRHSACERASRHCVPKDAVHGTVHELGGTALTRTPPPCTHTRTGPPPAAPASHLLCSRTGTCTGAPRDGGGVTNNIKPRGQA
jgi:hypothetical protein